MKDESEDAQVWTEIAYLRKHGEADRLKYPTFRSMGVPLGSGAIESSIRRVVNLRLKSNAIYWREENAEAMMQVRAHFSYPDADSILLLLDCGGSNSANKYIFKHDLQAVVNSIGIEIRVAHYPSYCSKYNPIERRFFPHVTHACTGMLFDTLQTAVDLMRKASTATGLCTSNPVDPMVDDVAAELLLTDHVLANGLQRLRPEVDRLGRTVQLAKGPDRLLHALKLSGGFAVLAVIRLGKLQYASSISLIEMLSLGLPFPFELHGDCLDSSHLATIRRYFSLLSADS